MDLKRIVKKNLKYQVSGGCVDENALLMWGTVENEKTRNRMTGRALVTLVTTKICKYHLWTHTTLNPQAEGLRIIFLYIMVCTEEWIRRSVGSCMERKEGKLTKLHFPLHSPVCIVLSCLLCPQPDIWISSSKWQDHLKEEPTGLALPGFQRPSNLDAAGCQRVDWNVWWWDNLYETEPKAVCLFDRLINGKPLRKKKSPISAEGSREKKPSLITRTPGIKACPALIN